MWMLSSSRGRTWRLVAERGQGRKTMATLKRRASVDDDAPEDEEEEGGNDDAADVGKEGKAARKAVRSSKKKRAGRIDGYLGPPPSKWVKKQQGQRRGGRDQVPRPPQPLEFVQDPHFRTLHRHRKALSSPSSSLRSVAAMGGFYFLCCSASV